jgi:hypothetical protein
MDNRSGTSNSSSSGARPARTQVGHLRNRPPRDVHKGDYAVSHSAQRVDAARASYLRSLDADPLAISTIAKLSKGEFGKDSPALDDWIGNRLGHLRALDDNIADRLHSYQRYEGALGRDALAAGAGDHT